MHSFPFLLSPPLMDLNAPLAPPDVNPPTMDLADEVKGMYRVLEIISESNGNGNGEKLRG